MTYLHWRDRLGEANDPAFYPLEYQDYLLASGNGHFWEAPTAAMVTELKPYPSGAIACVVYAAAGDMAALMDMKPQIEAWAKARGCTHCMIEGRDGWRKVHPDYRHHKTVIVKEL